MTHLLTSVCPVNKVLCGINLVLNVYKFALEKGGVSVDKYVPAAYEGMVDIMLSQKPSFALAHDTVIGDADKELDGTFAALKKIR